MDTETITEAPGNDSGAEDNAGNPTTVEELANSFIERVEESPEPETTDSEAGETAEAEEGEAEDVLSQSSQSEGEEETEAEEEAEEESSEPPKGVGKLLKQVGKLTARAKSAEERVEAMQAKIAALESQPQQETKEQGQPALEDIQSMGDLEKLRKEAMSAKRWALQHVGKDYVEVDGKEYEDQDIRTILTEAEDFLAEKIPERANFLQQRQQWVTDATSTFPFLSDVESSDYKLFLQVRGGEQYSKILDQLPNGDFVAATLVKGINALKAESKGKKPAKKKLAKTPPATLEESVAPPPTPKTDRQEKKIKAAIAQGNISPEKFAELLT